MTENIEDAGEQGLALDLEEAEVQAEKDVIAEREEALAKQLAEMRRRKQSLWIHCNLKCPFQAEDLTSYVPSFGWEMAPPSDQQVSALEKLGILPDQN